VNIDRRNEAAEVEADRLSLVTEDWDILADERDDLTYDLIVEDLGCERGSFPSDDDSVPVEDLPETLPSGTAHYAANDDLDDFGSEDVLGIWV
jgi:hypothetical protein